MALCPVVQVRWLAQVHVFALCGFSLWKLWQQGRPKSWIIMIYHEWIQSHKRSFMHLALSISELSRIRWIEGWKDRICEAMNLALTERQKFEIEIRESFATAIAGARIVCSGSNLWNLFSKSKKSIHWIKGTSVANGTACSYKSDEFRTAEFRTASEQNIFCFAIGFKKSGESTQGLLKLDEFVDLLWPWYANTTIVYPLRMHIRMNPKEKAHPFFHLPYMANICISRSPNLGRPTFRSRSWVPWRRRSWRSRTLLTSKRTEPKRIWVNFR